MLESLKESAKGLPYPVFLRTFLALYCIRDLRKNRKACRTLGLTPLQALDLSQVKSSDTVFLLGGGASINQIPEGRWQAIARHDSIGMSFWPAHRFVPKMYFHETIARRTHPKMYEAFRQIMQARITDYRQTVNVLTEASNGAPDYDIAWPLEAAQPTYTVHTFPVAARNESEFAYGIRYLRSWGLFRRSDRIGYVFKQASTLSSLVALAARMGYRRIVLCGIDLNRGDYFYQDPVLYPETAALEFNPRDQAHPTISPMEWRVPVDTVILELKRQVLDPEGLEIYVENRSSALWPRIPEAPTSLFEVPARIVAGKRA